jgi:ASPIC and UnbV
VSKVSKRNPLRQHVGVGKNASISEVETWWPTSTTTQSFHGVPADHAFHVQEGAGTLEPRNYKSFPSRKLGSDRSKPSARNSGLQA